MGAGFVQGSLIRFEPVDLLTGARVTSPTTPGIDGWTSQTGPIVTDSHGQKKVGQWAESGGLLLLTAGAFSVAPESGDLVAVESWQPANHNPRGQWAIGGTIALQ